MLGPSKREGKCTWAWGDDGTGVVGVRVLADQLLASREGWGSGPRLEHGQCLSCILTALWRDTSAGKGFSASCVGRTTL